MMRIEPNGRVYHCAPALPVAGQRDQHANESIEGPVRAIQPYRSLRNGTKSWQLPPEEQALGESLVGQRTRWREFDGPLRGCLRSPQWIRLPAEAKHILVGVERREHRPTVAIARRFLHGPLEKRPHAGVLFWRH